MYKQIKIILFAVVIALASTVIIHIQELAALPHIKTPHENIPEFASNPNITAVNTGLWSNTSAWSLGRIPSAGDVVVIPNGTTITYNITSNIAIDSIGIKGKLKFSTNLNTSLKVANIMIYPEGELEIGNKSNPVNPDVMAEIIIADKALDLILDPEQFGTGLIALGKVTIHGAARDRTFVRLTQEPMTGDTMLYLKQPVTGWKENDELILPDTRNLKWNEVGEKFSPQWEELRLQSVSDDGKIITLKSALQFDHPGGIDGNDVLEFLPHIGNLSRNVIIRSEDPDGTRGHALFTHRADVDIRYTQFKDLGRTKKDKLDNTTFDENGEVKHIGENESWRYRGIHMHHLIGPFPTTSNDGYQFKLIGNAVHGGYKDYDYIWAITIHDGHYGLIKQNVIYNSFGAGIATEDGGESFNRFEDNFVMRIRGTGNRDDMGREGEGFWFRGINNYVVNNVAANIMGPGIAPYSYGYVINQKYLENIKVPKFAGADLSVPGEYTEIDGHSIPLLEFSGNEVYGATSRGMTIWWVGAFGSNQARGTAGVIKDLKIWNVFNMGIFLYATTDLTIDGVIIRGDDTGIGIYGGDYRTTGLLIKNADIQRVWVGIRPSTNGLVVGDVQIVRIEDSYLRNFFNILLETPFTSSAWAGKMAGRKVILKDTILELPKNPKTTWLSPTPYNIIKKTDRGWHVTNSIVSDTLYVYNHNRQPGLDFQVFYEEQHPDSVIPGTTYNLDDSERKVGSPIGTIPKTDFNNDALVATLIDNKVLRNMDYNKDVQFNWQIEGETELTERLNQAGITDNAQISEIVSIWQSTILTNKDGWETYGISIAGGIAPCYDNTSYPDIKGYVCDITEQQEAPALTPPLITNGPTISQITSTSITIVWSTDKAANSTIEEQDSKFVPIVNNSTVISHSITVEGLVSSTTYNLKIKSGNDAGEDMKPVNSWLEVSTLATTGIQINKSPIVLEIPEQEVHLDGSIAIALDDYVNDPDNQDSEITWTISENSVLAVSINENRVASITVKNESSYAQSKHKSEIVTLTATDPYGLSDSVDVQISILKKQNEAEPQPSAAHPVTIEEDSGVSGGGCFIGIIK